MESDASVEEDVEVVVTTCEFCGCNGNCDVIKEQTQTRNFRA